MSHSSNYNLIRLFVDKNLDPKSVIDKLINDHIDQKFKVKKAFRFDLGKQNDSNSLLEDNEKQLLTFNISKNRRFLWSSSEDIKYEMYNIFRKKDFNTLYEVNTIPRIIKFQNSNNYDKDYVIDWSLFEDMILLTNKVNSNMLKIYKIFFKGFVYFENNTEVK